MKHTQKSTIKFNLNSIFILSIMIPLFILPAIFTIYYNYVIQQENNRNVSNILSSVSENIVSVLKDLETISNTCYMHKNIFSALESFNNPKLYSNYDKLELLRLQDEYTDAMTKLMFTSQQHISNISFFPISPESTEFYSLSKNWAVIDTIEYKDYHSQDWFEQTLSNKKTILYYSDHIPSYLDSKYESPVFSALKLIRSMDSKKSIGVLKIDSQIENLENILDSIEINESYHILITDRQGHVIAGQSDDFKQIPRQYEEGTVKIEGKTFQVLSKSIPRTDWNLVYLSPAAAAVITNTLYPLGISFIFILLITLTAFLIYTNRSNAIVKSVSNITNTLKQLELGHLEVRSQVSSNNELKIISDSLNRMAMKLNEYIEQEYISVINQQKTEYKALQSQINPHFLYNTLNGFIALNRMGEKVKLEKSIIHLTHLFQYTCHTQDSTCLKDEFQFLGEYLKLQKLKYDERLEFSIFLGASCETLSIPKLLLQPIVENCILHGLEPTRETIHINIFGELVNVGGIGEMVVLIISDDGVGYDQSSAEIKVQGIGMKNVQTRLSLFYRESIYEITSFPQKGTKTKIIFSINDRQQALPSCYCHE